MNQPDHHQIATYLTDYVLSELVKYVMEDTGCSIEEAMEQVASNDSPTGRRGGTLCAESRLPLRTDEDNFLVRSGHRDKRTKGQDW